MKKITIIFIVGIIIALMGAKFFWMPTDLITSGIGLIIWSLGGLVVIVALIKEYRYSKWGI